MIKAIVHHQKENLEISKNNEKRTLKMETWTSSLTIGIKAKKSYKTKLTPTN